MSSTWGNSLKVSLFGESHGQGLGVVIDSPPPGERIDFEQTTAQMARRAPGQNAQTTARREPDMPRVLSGYFDGHTTGTPLCAVIENTDTRSKDYAGLKSIPRPGHADYTGLVRYKGFGDYRGGGHFSGRITAGLVFAGAVLRQVLSRRGVECGAHIASIHGVRDKGFDPVGVSPALLSRLSAEAFPLIDPAAESPMRRKIDAAAANKDSVGGVIECAVTGLPAGVGSPFFDSIESVLAHLIFSIPAVKGVEFGAGFGAADMTGSACNDPFVPGQNGPLTTTNHAGGILGGLTSGMPLIFRVAIKPTPSIGREQQSIHLGDNTPQMLKVQGRHDPCIVARAAAVVESAAILGLYDLLKGQGIWNL